jgi:hypothetical protein
MCTLAAFGLTPLANATTASQRAQAQECVKAFVAEAVPSRPVQVRVDDYVAPMSLLFRDELTLTLTAVDKATGETIAAADCRMKPRGEVSITELPAAEGAMLIRR